MDYKVAYKPSPETYSGEIEVDDFNTYYPNKQRINNQAIAEKFPQLLREYRERKSYIDGYKDMTLEELREMKLVSNTSGHPTSALTDEKWQKEFALRRMFITPYKKQKRMGGKYSMESGTWNEDTIYHGATNWQQHCSFINDVLSVIRSGQKDFVYCIYQIEDLLKFHYNDLRTKYCDGYWEVWLEKGVKYGI